LPFVSLRLSKARSLLPKRKMLASASLARRVCESRRSLPVVGLERYFGPVPVGGKFFTNRSSTNSDSWAPRIPKESWWPSPEERLRRSTSRRGNWEPVFLSLRPLKSSEVRILSKNPSEKVLRKFTSGEHSVYPVREDVRVFQRKAWAFYHIRHVVDSVYYVRPSRDLCEILGEASHLLRMLFGRARNLGRDVVSLQKQIAYHRRWASKFCVPKGLEAKL